MLLTSFQEGLLFGDKIKTKVILETAFSKEIRILLKAGQVMKQHQTKFPIVVHLLQGEIAFGVENTVHRIKEGDILTLEANVPHDLSAIQDSVVRLTLSKSDDVARVEKVIEASE
ncbi:cupin domain-containing protein [uncultured Arcticibacterium sp.]|uniref:cupin domain-containing protein n=1 Tax=uncultured Arcticibacterium sp. TaxID=2173042 RepID=UPI0030F72025